MEPDVAALDRVTRRGPDKCKVALILDELDEQDRATTLFAIENPGQYRHADVVKWLKSLGIGISDKSVAAHRTGDCCCGN